MKKNSLLISSLILTLCVSTSFVILNQSNIGMHFYAEDKEPFGILLGKTENKLFNFGQYSNETLSNDVSLISKQGVVSFEFKNIKSNEGCWQIIKNNEGYILNKDHIIGMDGITLKVKSIANDGILDILYSGNSIDLLDSNSYHASNHSLKKDEIKEIYFNFNDLKPNYFALKVRNADLEILSGRIHINSLCHDFYHDLQIKGNDKQGAVSGSGLMKEGSNVTIFATPNKGYFFSGWFNEKDELVSKENPYNFVMPDHDLVLDCRFDMDESILKIFGSYPQSRINDETLCSDLNKLAGDLPIETDSKTWTSYHYYQKKSNLKDFMWYKDIILDGGNKYRGVYFTSYRPYWTSGGGGYDETVQDNNGYLINNIYWFKFEPIVWRILNQEALVISDIILDSQDFYHDNKDHYHNEDFVHSNNYETSDIRTWLNSSFYETSFNNNDKKLIKNTLVTNDLESTTDTSNKFICNDTLDNVFLLSKKDIKTAEHGLDTDSSRQVKCSDYAACMGCKINIDNGNSNWWLRSPGSKYSYQAGNVNFKGQVNNFNVYSTSFSGVRPAMHLDI